MFRATERVRPRARRSKKQEPTPWHIPYLGKIMKTKQELSLEISILKERLNKAVVFEVTEDISIGISEIDGLFRIRRQEPDGEISFLNKDCQWEEQARHVDLAYSERTGYYTAEEAFNMLEVVQGFVDGPVIVQTNALKNN